MLPPSALLCAALARFALLCTSPPPACAAVLYSFRFCSAILYTAPTNSYCGRPTLLNAVRPYSIRPSSTLLFACSLRPCPTQPYAILLNYILLYTTSRFTYMCLHLPRPLPLPPPLHLPLPVPLPLPLLLPLLRPLHLPLPLPLPPSTCTSTATPHLHLPVPVPLHLRSGLLSSTLLYCAQLHLPYPARLYSSIPYATPPILLYLTLLRLLCSYSTPYATRPFSACSALP